jgi:hypothetical protein
MLDLNLKSDIQKNIKTERLKTRKDQTEFDRVPTLTNIGETLTKNTFFFQKSKSLNHKQKMVLCEFLR